jgi:hypothetical protein
MRIIKFLIGLPIRLMIGGVILLIVLALGIFWGARAVLAPQTEQPATMAPEPTALMTAIPVPATQAPPAVSPTPTASAPPTAIPTPVPTAVPAGLSEEIVQSGEGLYMVCRRHCPGRWPPDDDALATYAEEVAELNGLSWPNPALSPGQSLHMPPCPQ